MDVHMGNHTGQREVPQAHHFCSWGMSTKKALRMSGRHLSCTLKDAGKAAEGKKHASPYHMYSLEL